jgi:hypothetical protein
MLKSVAFIVIIIYLFNLMKTMSNTKYNNTQSLYAISGSVIKDFISKKDYLPEEAVDRRMAHENQYGFITALFDGFVSDGNKRVNINLI